eukprot:TRINITY_DN46064_c0_g1_i1.p2 TRINITY_DN46064_c0_g1~~TRINITY_DN46064_c0_g1_i1.p2  ORF type:complete len:146 (+),score=34.19 TRINITY_DN46064_c0_g1_i1:72-509(+)
MIRRPPRSTLSSSSAASDVYKRQEVTKDELQSIIASHDLVIFSAPVGPNADKICPYVAKTVAALDAAEIPYYHQVVGPKGTPSRTALIELCQGVGTVPEGFCLGQWIGGYDASDGGHLGAPGITPLFESGKLQAALATRDVSALQ